MPPPTGRNRLQCVRVEPVDVSQCDAALPLKSIQPKQACSLQVGHVACAQCKRLHYCLPEWLIYEPGR